MFKIGTLADWFGVGLLEGIRESEKCGATGVQVYAWNELDPRKAEKGFVDKVKDTASACHQEIVALCGELGGHGFEIAAKNPPKVEYLMAVVDLCSELNCRILTTHVGVVPEDVDSEVYKVMQDACNRVGDYAIHKGVTVAIETGPEPIKRLKRFVDGCQSGGVGVNYDPGNLVMVTRDDEVAGVAIAGSSIVHTHAKDGLMHKYYGPEKAYAVFAEGGIEAMTLASEYFQETPLGEGSVRWPEYLRALQAIGYSGYLTIEREVKDGADDIRRAVTFLQQTIQNL